MTARKHPFHWDVYSKLYDGLEAVLNSNDRRLDPLVRSRLEGARAELWKAWDLQAALERAQMPPDETRRRIEDVRQQLTGGAHG